MPSPFPGMNPYLENPDHWRDFHGMYLAYLRVRLAELVRPRYLVRLEENVYLKEVPEEGTRFRTVPDLSVYGPAKPLPTGGATAVAAPTRAVFTLPAVEEVREPKLHILDRGTLKLVTVVELLSPTNKTPGADREAYLSKRHRQVSAGVGFVEIDLRRAGPRMVAGLPECDYVAVVARQSDLPAVAAWPVRITDPLPAVPVPLLPGDPQPLLDLQAALHAVYDEVGYGEFIYTEPPDPPLTPEQAAWAAPLLPPEAAR